MTVLIILRELMLGRFNHFCISFKLIHHLFEKTDKSYCLLKKSKIHKYSLIWYLKFLDQVVCSIRTSPLATYWWHPQGSHYVIHMLCSGVGGVSCSHHTTTPSSMPVFWWQTERRSWIQCEERERKRKMRPQRNMSSVRWRWKGLT